MTPLNVKRRTPFFARGRWLILGAGFVLTLALCALSLARPAFLTHLDGRFFDGLVSDQPPPRNYPSPVVVALDDESLTRFGRWPWPRALVARLLTRIAEHGPASVGIDAIFAEQELPLPANAAATSETLSAGDQALKQALAAGPFVLGFELTFAPSPDPTALERLLYPLNVVSLAGTGGADPRARLWQASGVVASRAEFFRCVSGAGFINAAMEQDGVLRRMPVLIKQGERIYPSLALATVLRSGTVSEALLASTWSGECSLRIGKRRIPLDDRGRLLLRYRESHATATPLPAWQLLEGRVPQGTLQGRIVFVGATATGMGEAVVTPVKHLLSGVQVHAIAAENILSGDLARICPWIYGVLATLALGVLATFVCVALPVMRGALLLAVAAVVAWQGSVWLFQADGLLLSPVLPLIALLANFSLLSLIRAFFEEKKEQRQTRDLAKSREFIITSLAALTEIRDIETGAHIMRTQRYLLVLCQELSHNPRFQPLLDQATIELISKLAPLHDIGKVGLPDHLLHKTTAFTADEYEQVKQHAAFGRDAIVKAESRAGVHDDELLQFAKDMAYTHHERWNGSGYPEGLRGEQIPWPGRIMAVADAYDAIISRRVYKEPIPHESAVGIIINGSGVLFDPDVVDAFVKVADEWWKIACDLVDADNGKSGEGSGD